MNVGLIKHKKQSQCFMIISSHVSGDWSLVVYCDKKKRSNNHKASAPCTLHDTHYMKEGWMLQVSMQRQDGTLGLPVVE